MSRLNVFESFQSKHASHEDQLTRTFLVVLRCSPASLLFFYDYVYISVNKLINQKKLQTIIPSISEIDFEKMEIETQKSNIKDLLCDQLISVLITDQIFDKPLQDIAISERGARYDGIVSFPDRLTLLIENKPNYYNVWDEQLHPSLLSLADVDKEIELVKVPALLEWKEIIKKLSKLLPLNSINGTEKIIIEDFLEFIDSYFPSLNPYDNFAQCKNYLPHLKRRANNILKSLVVDENTVKYHRGWANSYIETSFEEIRMVGLIIREENNIWYLRIELWFGDTMNQARSFYNSNIQFEEILSLANQGWQYDANFHISHIQHHLIWFSTSNNEKETYYDYWSKNYNNIRQYSKDDLPRYLDELGELKIIDMNEEIRIKVEQEIINTNRNYFNVCPGFGLVYEYDSIKAVELDKQDKLIPEIKTKIAEGLSILNKNIDFLKL